MHTHLLHSTLGLLGIALNVAAGGVCSAAEGLGTSVAASDGNRTFYVDSEDGADNNAGLSPGDAWRTLDRVNSAELKPGDTVQFKCGGVWRGSLTPASGENGAPVSYTSYGQGERPLLLGSRPRDRAEDWVQVAENVWATRPLEYELGEEVNLRESRWNYHQEAGAHIQLERTESAEGVILRINCTDGGSASNHLQLWGPSLDVQKGACLMFTFRARSSRPFVFPRVAILRNGAPWTRYASSAEAGRPLAEGWSTYQVPIHVEQSAEDGRIHIALGGLMPPGTVLEFQPQSLRAATPSIPDPLDVDVGNIIFDRGNVCGWKKWSLDDLVHPYDYYYDRSSQRVFLYSDANPASRCESLELALARHIVNQSGKHHVVYDGLALMYGAAHGFGGGNTHDIVIRNCDLGYIGGAHQHTRPDGTPVRYGNAIEFWGAARDNLVENCRIWEVYDAALTNQGRGPDSKQSNITYRNNIIWNAEYSFEYWNHPEAAVTRNIRFVNNTCVGAGRGWAHAQRPDPNGSHLMFYSNTARTSNIEIKYNIFYDHTEWGSRYSSGWEVLPEIDYNLWYSQSGVMAYWFREKIAGFEEYQEVTGLESHSRFADPEFVDVGQGDYRLRPESPARDLRPGGGPVGAEPLWE